MGVATADVLLTLPTGESNRFQTDAQGRYRMRGLPPGTYGVRVEGYGIGESRQNLGIERTVEVGAGESACDIELASTLITGRVVRGTTGEPVFGAHVALYGSETWAVAQATCEPGANRFELEVPGAGVYGIAVATKPGEAAAGWLGPVTIEEGVGLQDVVVPLGGPGGISVTVQDAVTNARLSGAAVRLSAAGGPFFQASADSSADGTALLDNLSPGRYRVEAETDEHVVAAAEVVVEDAAVATTLVLERASSIVVEVRGDLRDRKPVCLEARVVGGGDPGWSRKLQCGTPKVPDLAQIVLKARPGDYHLRFVVLAHGRRTLDDPKNTVSELDVRVPETGNGAALVQISTE
jgi:hypothetical protein